MPREMARGVDDEERAVGEEVEGVGEEGVWFPGGGEVELAFLVGCCVVLWGAARLG